MLDAEVGMRVPAARGNREKAEREAAELSGSVARALAAAGEAVVLDRARARAAAADAEAARVIAMVEEAERRPRKLRPGEAPVEPDEWMPARP